MLRLCRAGRQAGAFIAILVLAGCAFMDRTPPPSSAPSSEAAKPAPDTPVEARLPVEATPPGAGYYKVGTPYEVNGQWYHPRVDYAYRETGIASWYGAKFHGRETANGEVFNRRALTAAHPTLPMPSLVRVTNLENGRQLKMRINDRGPFARGRILDVSERGAELLGFKEQGTARVRIEIMEVESRRLAAAAGADGEESAPAAAPTEGVVAASLSGDVLNDGNGVDATRSRSSIDVARSLPAPEPDGYVEYGPPEATTMYIQAGAFSREDNARQLRERLSAIADARIHTAKVNEHTFYRVRLGPLTSVDDADRLLEKLAGQGMHEAKVILE